MVYVDKLRRYSGRWINPMWCHMWADTEKEMFDMAKKIGLDVSDLMISKRGFRHFDLQPSKRKLALSLGTSESSLKNVLRNMRKAPNTY